MLRLSVYLSAVMFLFSVIMNIDGDEDSASSHSKANSKESDRLKFIYKATLSNRELSNNRSWFHVLMVFFLTFLTIGIVR